MIACALPCHPSLNSPFPGLEQAESPFLLELLTLVFHLVEYFFFVGRVA
jgi:hypothetical protein